VSQELSPREIILRWQLSYDKHAKAPFGCYCEAHDDVDGNKTNTQKERSREAIYLGPTGNFQGTSKFFDLETGKVIKRRKFTELPMPDSVIKKVEKWADKDKQRAGMPYRNRRNERYDWDTDTDEGLSTERPLMEDNAAEEEAAPFPAIPAEMPGVLIEENMPVEAVASEEQTDEDRAAAARENANFGPGVSNIGEGPNIVEDDSGESNGRTYSITWNLPNEGPATIEEEAEGANDSEEVPELLEGGENSDSDSSDDESDDENEENDDEEVGNNDGSRRTRGGRPIPN